MEVGIEAFRQLQSGKSIQKNRFFHPKVTEGSDGHVPGNSGKTIKVKNSHGNFWPEP
jgi:hypothetical protein